MSLHSQHSFNRKSSRKRVIRSLSFSPGNPNNLRNIYISPANNHGPLINEEINHFLEKYVNPSKLNTSTQTVNQKKKNRCRLLIKQENKASKDDLDVRYVASVDISKEGIKSKQVCCIQKPLYYNSKLIQFKPLTRSLTMRKEIEYACCSVTVNGKCFECLEK